MPQLPQLDETVEQKIAKLDKDGAETLEALLSTKTLTAAADKLKLSRQRVYDRIDKYGLDELMADLRKKAVFALTQGSVDAAENLINKISSDNEEISLKASTETLDRIGISKPQTPKGGDINLNFGSVAERVRSEFTASDAV